MPKVLVCYKWVLDESDIRINPDLSVDFSKAKYKISDYDKHTIEAGSQAAKALGGTCTGISCGGAETRKSFNDALARGMAEGIWVNTAESVRPDGCRPAALLAAADIFALHELAGKVVCAAGLILLAAATVLTVWSGIVYLVKNRKVLQEEKI